MIVALLTATGCAHPAQSQLQGRWFGDTVENIAPDEVAATTQWARATSLEFSGSHVTVVIPAEEPRSGDFEIVAFDRGDVTLAVRNIAGERYKTELSIDADDRLRWHLGEGRWLVLRREL